MSTDSSPSSPRMATTVPWERSYPFPIIKPQTAKEAKEERLAYLFARMVYHRATKLDIQHTRTLLWNADVSDSILALTYNLLRTLHAARRLVENRTTYPRCYQPVLLTVTTCLYLAYGHFHDHPPQASFWVHHLAPAEQKLFTPRQLALHTIAVLKLLDWRFLWHATPFALQSAQAVLDDEPNTRPYFWELKELDVEFEVSAFGSLAGEDLEYWIQEVRQRRRGVRDSRVGGRGVWAFGLVTPELEAEGGGRRDEDLIRGFGGLGLEEAVGRRRGEGFSMSTESAWLGGRWRG